MIFLKSPDAVGADFGLEANMHNEESEREKERAREKERETALQYTGRYVCVSESTRVEFLSPGSSVLVSFNCLLRNKMCTVHIVQIYS